MRDSIERQYECRVLQWDEPIGAMDGSVFSAYQRGRLVVAESLALLISALQENEPRPLLLMAA